MGNKVFTLRLSDDLRQYLEKKAKSLDISQNDYIKNLIMVDMLEGKQDKVLSELEEIKEMLKNLEK